MSQARTSNTLDDTSSPWWHLRASYCRSRRGRSAQAICASVGERSTMALHNLEILHIIIYDTSQMSKPLLLFGQNLEKQKLKRPVTQKGIIQTIANRSNPSWSTTFHSIPSLPPPASLSFAALTAPNNAHSSFTRPLPLPLPKPRCTSSFSRSSLARSSSSPGLIAADRKDGISKWRCSISRSSLCLIRVCVWSARVERRVLDRR